MTRQEQNAILARHGYVWRRTTPEDQRMGPGGLIFQPTEFWLVTYNSEDGEEIPVIACTHSGGDSKRHVEKVMRSAARRLAETLLAQEALAEATGKKMVTQVQEVYLP